MSQPLASPAGKLAEIRNPHRPLLRHAMAAVLIASLSSCIQPPPPRTYNPQVSRHLRQLSHNTPVTPIPSSCGSWSYYGYPYGCGY